MGYRDCEREIIPMCDSYGMAFSEWHIMSISVVHHFGHDMIGHVLEKKKMINQEVAWNVLGGGKFKTPEQLRAGTDLRADAAPSEADIALATILADMAEEIGQPGNLTGGTFDF